MLATRARSNVSVGWKAKLNSSEKHIGIHSGTPLQATRNFDNLDSMQPGNRIQDKIIQNVVTTLFS